MSLIIFEIQNEVRAATESLKAVTEDQVHALYARALSKAIAAEDVRIARLCIDVMTKLTSPAINLPAVRRVVYNSADVIAICQALEKVAIR